MNSVKEKLEKWLKENPEGWLTESDQSISDQAGVSTGSVSRHLHMVVAKRNGVMPSEVRKQRQETRPISRRTKVDLNKIREIIAANPDMPVCDLAFMADCSEATIERLLKAIGHGTDESQEDDDDDDQNSNSKIISIRSDLENIKVGMETVLTRLDELLND